jgi:hypothetical protein
LKHVHNALRRLASNSLFFPKYIEQLFSKVTVVEECALRCSKGSRFLVPARHVMCTTPIESNDEEKEAAERRRRALQALRLAQQQGQDNTEAAAGVEQTKRLHSDWGADEDDDPNPTDDSERGDYNIGQRNPDDAEVGGDDEDVNDEAVMDADAWEGDYDPRDIEMPASSTGDGQDYDYSLSAQQQNWESANWAQRLPPGWAKCPNAGDTIMGLLTPIKVRLAVTRALQNIS